MKTAEGLTSGLFTLKILLNLCGVKNLAAYLFPVTAISNF